MTGNRDQVDEVAGVQVVVEVGPASETGHDASGAGSQEACAWLRDLGLEHYAQAFADHHVDLQTLPHLTEADLAAIGVKSVGHRRKLIGAIATLRQGRLASAAASALSVMPAAEHRQLTVLCCDMVGSTALSERLHPEDLREVIRAFNSAGTRIVAEFDGHVANFIGDCVLAYFGWPRAHDDDAERAVRAGLAMVQAVSGLRTSAGGSLAVRVGIATGTVVVGDLIREGPARGHSAVGAAPELSDRLHALAEPGQVVIDELTQRLLAPSFAVQPLGRHALNGIEQPVAAYAVTGERWSDSRFDARKGLTLPPMVGRDHELALLLDRWRHAQGGEGQAVLLTGEAGIGKSRLARALLDACAGQRRRRLHWQGSPHHTGSALWPVVQQLTHSAGLLAQDPTDTALDKLEALTCRDGEGRALYAALLGLNGSQRYGPLDMTPQMLRERTMELLVEHLLELAGERPVLLVVEDAQWIDPTTLELVGRSLEMIGNARMLVVITSRLDPQPGLGAHPSVMRLSLSRLGRASAQALVAQAGGGGLQPHTRAAIVAQTDGVPLFVEELTKAVLESGEAAIPASLHGSLMARLDRIPEAREVAQIAACIGREFDQALVSAVAGNPEAVAAAIDKLAAAELIFRRGNRAHPRLAFKHALVQEAACESLLRSKRQRIHARILEILEGQGAQPEVLAHHAAGAALADKAIAYWSQAGNAAYAKCAYVEAAGYLGSAIELIRSSTDGVDRRSLELELQLQLGLAQTTLHGFSAQAIHKTYARAHELLEATPGKGPHRARAQYGLWAWHLFRADIERALQLALAALAAERVDGTPESQLFAHRMVATSHASLGNLAGARDHFESAMALVDSARRGELSAQLGFDPGISTLYHYSWALFLQGYADQSDKLMERARNLCLEPTQVTTQATVHFFSAMRSACARDCATVTSEAQALAGLAAEHRIALYDGHIHILLAWASMESGPSAAAASAACTRGLGTLDAHESRIYVPFFMARLAMGQATCGLHDEAKATIERALAECEETGQGWCDAELWRVRGDLVLRDPKRHQAEAEHCFERALAIARGRGVKLWELRAAVSLARLWAGRGERAQALDLLDPVYGWFTEGFATVDLVEARTLLSELRQ